MKKNKFFVLFSVLALVVCLFVYKQFSTKNTNEVKTTVDSSNNKTAENKDNAENKKNNSQVEPLEADKDITFEKLKSLGKPIILDFSQEH